MGCLPPSRGGSPGVGGVAAVPCFATRVTTTVSNVVTFRVGVPAVGVEVVGKQGYHTAAQLGGTEREVGAGRAGTEGGLRKLVQPREEC